VLFDNQTGTVHFGKWSDGTPKSYLEPGQAIYFTPDNFSFDREMTFDEELAKLNEIFKTSNLEKFPPPIIFYDKYWEYAPEIKKHIANNKSNKNQPLPVLTLAYKSFLTVRDCRENRKEYLKKYITESQYEQARKSIRLIEIEAKKKIPDLDVNKIWEDAVQTYKGGFSDGLVGSGVEWVKIFGIKNDKWDSQAEMLCSMALNMLFRNNPQVKNEKYEKDF